MMIPLHPALTPSPVRKVVIPAAGLGTRLLPATKVVPKDLLPIGSKPLILYAVEEAAASGAESVVLITRAGETLLRKYFEPDGALERHLREHGREHDAEMLCRICSMVEIRAVEQQRPAGLADAIRCARPVVKDEPFGVILPDAFITGKTPCIGQLIECYRRNPGIVIATRRVKPEETERYGILVVDDRESCDAARVIRVVSMIEKPKPVVAPSLYGVFGRYILDATVFEAIESISPDQTGELQLTAALNLCCQRTTVYGHLFEGSHFDAGDRLGFAQALVECMLAEPKIGRAFLAFMKEVTLRERA